MSGSWGSRKPARRGGSDRPRIAVTAGDPRGIGPEIAAALLRTDELRGAADWVLVGPEGVLEADEVEDAGATLVTVGRWDDAVDGAERRAGLLAGAAVERAARMALDGEVDGLVTAPLSKAALSAAGYAWPGHTELLRELSGVPEVTMIMGAEETPLGGPLRMAFLTGHVPLREVTGRLEVDLVTRRTRIAARALREWWGIGRPRVAFAGVNPHASEGGLLGDEEDRILAPALELLASDLDLEVDGIHPADTVFRRCLDGTVDAVVVPYHDVGLAVLKTIALERGINVTAGLPFPRTSPDHGTAFDIAGRGVADPSSMIEAAGMCVRFCRSVRPVAP